MSKDNQNVVTVSIFSSGSFRREDQLYTISTQIDPFIWYADDPDSGEYPTLKECFNYVVDELILPFLLDNLYVEEIEIDYYFTVSKVKGVDAWSHSYSIPYRKLLDKYGSK